MNAQPSVSVVVPVLNGAETIGDLLQALGSQAAVADVEVIVVDNGSTDGTADIVRGQPVTLLEEATPGPAAARNRGLHHASGDVIAHLDADTLPTRRWLTELVGAFADPRAVIAAGRNLSYRPETPAERYIAASGLIDAERAVTRDPFPFAPSMNMAVRRDAALAVGGWAEDMPTGEDVDFSFRILRRYGGPIAFQPGAVLFHRNRDTDARLRRQAWTYGEGAADMYLRYPDVVRWSVRKRLTVTRWHIARGLEPPLRRVAGAIGRGSEERLEFARYHRLWTRWFWRGFHSMRRHGERRPAP